MARTERLTPAQLAPAPWPTVASPDPVGEVARQFVINLRAAIDGASIRSVSATANLHHTTLLGILEGRTWPDLETIAKIELGLDAEVWPRRGQVR